MTITIWKLENTWTRENLSGSGKKVNKEQVGSSTEFQRISKIEDTRRPRQGAEGLKPVGLENMWERV